MFRTTPRVNLLQLRKDLLIAESELNRAQLKGDMAALKTGVQSLTRHASSAGAIASSAAMLVMGLLNWPRHKPAAEGAKSSWLQIALKGATLVSHLWVAFRKPEPPRADK